MASEWGHPPLWPLQRSCIKATAPEALLRFQVLLGEFEPCHSDHVKNLFCVAQNGHGQIYYVMTGTADVPRGWFDSTDLVLKYHVGTDRIVVESNYEAVLHKQK